MDTLHDDAHSAKGAVASLVQRSFAVKPEINALLDVSRKTYCEIIDDITSMSFIFNKYPFNVTHVFVNVCLLVFANLCIYVNNLITVPYKRDCWLPFEFFCEVL